MTLLHYACKAGAHGVGEGPDSQTMHPKPQPLDLTPSKPPRTQALRTRSLRSQRAVSKALGLSGALGPHSRQGDTDRGCPTGDPAAAVRLSQQLLALGADVTLRSRWTNMNALHYAAYFDVPDLVRVLLKGARPRGEGQGPGWESTRPRQGRKCPGCRAGDSKRGRWGSPFMELS